MSDDELETLRQIALMSMKSRSAAAQNRQSPALEPTTDSNQNNLASESGEEEQSSGGETEAGTGSGNVSDKKEEEEEVDEFMKEIEDFENFLGLAEEKPKKRKKSKSKKKKKKRSSKTKEAQDPRTEDKENICTDSEAVKNEEHSRSPSPASRHSSRERSPYSQRSQSPWEQSNAYEHSRRYSRSPCSPARHYHRSISRSLTPDSMRKRSPLSYDWPEPSRPKRRRSNSPTQQERWKPDEQGTRRYRKGPYHPRVPYYKLKKPQSDSESDDPELKKFEEERRKRGEERRRRQEEKRKFLEEQRQRLKEEREAAERKEREKQEKKKRDEEEAKRKKEEEEFQKKLIQVPEAERQRLIARRQKFLSNQPVKIEGTKKINLKHIKECEEGDLEEAEEDVEEEKEPQHEIVYHVEIDDDSSESESESRFKRNKQKRRRPKPQQTTTERIATKRKHDSQNERDKTDFEDLRATLQKKRALRKKKGESAEDSGEDIARNVTVEIQHDEEVSHAKKSKVGGRRVLILNKAKTVPVQDEAVTPKKRIKASAVSPRLSMIQRLGLPIKSEMPGRLSRVSKRIQEQEGRTDSLVRVLRIGSKGLDG